MADDKQPLHENRYVFFLWATSVAPSELLEALKKS